MIYWIFHLLARIFWGDVLQWAIADLIRLALTVTRLPRSIAGSPIASVLANLRTNPIDRLVASPDMRSSAGIWNL